LISRSVVVCLGFETWDLGFRGCWHLQFREALGFHWDLGVAIWDFAKRRDLELGICAERWDLLGIWNFAKRALADPEHGGLQMCAVR